MLKLKLLIAAALTLSAPGLHAQNPSPFQAAKTSYEQASHEVKDGESARQSYLSRLVEIRSGWDRTQPGENFLALDEEVRRHPQPVDGSVARLRKLRAGDWRSPRHDYRYRADGTWIMLPAGPDNPRGHWRIGGNGYFDAPEISELKDNRYTILLLNDKYFVFADSKSVFYETRLTKHP